MTDVAHRPTRTDIIDDRYQQVARLRQQAVTARTLARAFSDLAETVVDLPTRGDVADRATAHLADYAGTQSAACSAIAERHSVKADKLEADRP